MKNLQGKTVLLTGGGGGIGFEAAKVFAELGAKVLIAELDSLKGQKAAEILNTLHPDSAVFYRVDLSAEAQVLRLCEDIISAHGCPDAVFNNAAIVPLGTVESLDIDVWDSSYRVNLKAPVMLARYFLPHMKKRGSGCFVFVSSSGAAPFMSAYETFKTAQAEFAAALSMELENTGVYSYTIGPGLVKTETAAKSIEIVAAQMGITTDEFYAMNESHILDVGDAGRGFALSVLNADQYHGQEISSVQVLNDFSAHKEASGQVAADKELILKCIATFEAQYEGWKSRNVFERQWVLRDFKKCMGASADQVHRDLAEIRAQLQASPRLNASCGSLFERLKGYWERQLKLLQGFEKDPAKLRESSAAIRAWIADLEAVLLYF